MAYINQSRNSCALHGALSTFGAIERTFPIIHSTSGCGVQYQYGVAQLGGALTQASAIGSPLSSTNISEKHIVFGGGSRLREQIKNTVKVVDADLYPILTSCATEMVGDDIPAMTKEGTDQRFPVIYANTPGFIGGFHRGYELALRSLIEQLPTIYGDNNIGVDKKSVNLLGVIPNMDIYWQGHLRQLTNILQSIGITVNPLLGIGQTIDGWRDIAKASVNIVLSPWGISSAKLLNTIYGTDYIVTPELPIGPLALRRLVNDLAGIVDFDIDRAEIYLNKEDKLFDAYLSTLSSIYYTRGFQRTFGIVGNLALITGITRFLDEVIGMIPQIAIVTDPVNQDEHAGYIAPLRQTLESYNAELIFTEDSVEISDNLLSNKPELILGSSYERETAQKLDVPLVSVSFPIADGLILSKGYIGTDGGVLLIEDLGNAIACESRGTYARLQL